MDHFQGVVIDYLRANRATFVNTECCLQLNPGANPDKSGAHWYCDAVAVNLQHKRAYLCEITYSKSLVSLVKRLASWSAEWRLLRLALERDCAIPREWPTRPWVFIPEALGGDLTKALGKIQDLVSTPDHMPRPKVTWLEEVTPWKYRSWDREHPHEDDT